MLKNIAKPLLSWYDENARILPWREDPSPYRVWVSEIMLQQTRVVAVRPYFERFLTALPDVRSLANCPEDELMKLWEGLGYYNRVRNMQKAAKMIMEQYAGQIPADVTKIRELPGIGSYTAGAIVSIAYNIPAPAVDGNVMRVLSRVTASREDIMKQSVRKQMEEALAEVIPVKRAGDFTQAMIELGAIVCVPNGKAKCGQCPLSSQCLAFEKGIVDELPKKKAPKERRIEEKTVLILESGNKVAVRKRPAKGLLAGLYELPNLEGTRSAEEVLQCVKEWGLSALRILPLENAKHIFSHVEWHMTGYAIRIEEPEDADTGSLLFVDIKETEEKYAIPAAFAAYARHIGIALGQEKYEEV